MGPREQRPLSALPSTRARALAFLAIVVGGASGALIAVSLVRLQCRGECTAVAGVALVVGAGLGAAGVAVVAVLVLRAMAEWRRMAGARPGVGGEPDGGPGGGPGQPTSRSSRKPSA